MLIGCALLTTAEPGRTACIFAVSYAMMRFILELLRGDPVRPVCLGISEAQGWCIQWWCIQWWCIQWWCIVTAVACAVARPAWWTIAAATLVAAATLALAATRHRRQLAEPHHVRDLETRVRRCSRIRRALAARPHWAWRRAAM